MNAPTTPTTITRTATLRRMLPLVVVAGLTLAATRMLPANPPAPPAPPTPPVPATIATCDVYAVVEALVETEAYLPMRKSEEARITAILQPLEADLKSREGALRLMNPQDPKAQEMAAEFEQRRQAFTARAQQLSSEYTAMVGRQFVDAYTRATAAARGVATQRGFSHVLNVKSGPIIAGDNPDPRRLIEDMLARPVLIAPDGSAADLTAAVRAALNLPEKTGMRDASAERDAVAPTPASTTPPPPEPAR
jgi:Skp family chaperone for outer membrane proteins